MKGYKKIELYQEALKFELLEDYKAAFNLYLASAKQGYAKAQLAVGKYFIGEGLYKGIIKEDRAKGIEYLNQASAGGNAEAKYLLALILLANKNGNDTKRAVELLQDASERQYYLATFALAKCYYYGIGFKQSLVKTLAIFEDLVYVKGAFAQRECCNGMRTILGEIRSIIKTRKDKIIFENEVLHLFYDLCCDLNVDD